MDIEKILRFYVILFRLVFYIWGFSSAGRAVALQAIGQEFDPPNLQFQKKYETYYVEMLQFLDINIDVKT